MSFRLDDLQRIAAKAFDEIGPDRWTPACEHVKKVVQQTKANDFSIDQQTEETFIINLADDRNSGSDDADKSAQLLLYHLFYTTLTNFSTKYIMMCKVYNDVGGIK